MLSRTSLITLLSSVPAITALVEPDGTGRLPALGWSSWNTFECDIDEDKILSTAQQIVDLGLKDLGYEYVNIDDCWSVKDGRDEDTGRLVPDPDKFPNGIDGLADQIHDMGLKIGIYSSAGDTTCADYPASIDNEQIDAETWAEWGVDYLKYDNCGIPDDHSDEYDFCERVNSDDSHPNATCPDMDNPPPDDYDWSTSDTAQRYAAMRDALLQQNRTILFSICDWGKADVQVWGNQTGASWRMSGDIQPDWSQISQIFNQNSFLAHYTGFWGHSDADMLEVGNDGITFEEARTHFAFWAAMKSPLIIGADLTQIDDDYLEIMSNQILVRFNQDPVIGEPATPYKWGYNDDWTFDQDHPAEYWSGSSTNGTLLLMWNSEDDTTNRTFVWNEIPQLQGHDSYKATDIWSGENLGCIKDQYSAELDSHDTAGLLITGQCDGAATPLEK